MAWLTLNRHWLALGFVGLVVVAAAASPEQGSGRWVAVGLLGVGVLLLGIYALTRFVAWASQHQRDT